MTAAERKKGVEGKSDDEGELKWGRGRVVCGEGGVEGGWQGKVISGVC